MRDIAYIFYDPKKFIIGALAVLIVIPISLVILLNTRASAMNQAPAYTGGASVSKVFSPANGTTADGSTITITCTGAVIKQSPGGSAYRQGWIDPATIGSMNSSSDLKGHITNAQSSSNVCKKPSTTTSTTHKAPPPPQVKSSQTTNRTSNNTTNNYYSQSQNSQTQAAQPSYSSAKIPNTGSGSVLALGGISAVLGTIGHLFYQRLRFR